MSTVLDIQKSSNIMGTSQPDKSNRQHLFFCLTGEFVAIMGAQRVGKTTLLNCISTIDRVTSGHIL